MIPEPASPPSYPSLAGVRVLIGDDKPDIRQVKTLSAAAEGEKIPAAALTAYTGDAEERESLAAGFQKHIKKPVEPDQLVSVVADLTRIGRD
ncbi:MAG: response regulator [Nostocales cyanobacterium]|nr:MAG: response regulator [Nostocales cyanobacterium]